MGIWHSRVSKWYMPSEVEDMLSVAHIGDLLEFSCNDEGSEWCVYVGWNQNRHQACVVWLKDPTYGNSSMLTKALVCEPLVNVLMQLPKVKVRINKERDKKWDPLRNDEIVKRAYEANDMGYKIDGRSSRHFAQWCRYGDRKRYCGLVDDLS